MSAAAAAAAWAAFVADFPRILDEYLPRSYRAIVEYLSADPGAGMPNALLHGSYGFPIDLLWREAIRRQAGGGPAAPAAPAAAAAVAPAVAPAPAPAVAPATAPAVAKVFEKSLIYYEHPQYFEIDLADPNQDRGLAGLVPFIEGVIKHRCIFPDSRQIIVLRNIHRLIDDSIFRILLERFSQNAYFICTTPRLDAIKPPIQSRFIKLRVPALDPETIGAILNHLNPGGAGTAAAAPRSRHFLRELAGGAADSASFRGGPADIRGGPADIAALFPKPAARKMPPPPRLQSIREVAVRAYSSCTPLAQFAIRIFTVLSEHKKIAASGAAHEFLQTAARIEHEFAQSTRARAPIYYERVLVAAVRIVFLSPIFSTPGAAIVVGENESGQRRPRGSRGSRAAAR